MFPAECMPATDEDQCNAMEGLYLGDGTQCPSSSCSAGAFDGACCVPAGECFYINRWECENLAGVHNGEGVLCLSVNCEFELCPADTNNDGRVDVEDILRVVNQWGPCF